MPTSIDRHTEMSRIISVYFAFIMIIIVTKFRVASSNAANHQLETAIDSGQ